MCTCMLPPMVCFSPGDDEKKAPTRDEQAEAEKKREEEEREAEEGVDTAHDFMKKFLKKSEG